MDRGVLALSMRVRYEFFRTVNDPENCFSHVNKLALLNLFTQQNPLPTYLSNFPCSWDGN